MDGRYRVEMFFWCFWKAGDDQTTMPPPADIVKVAIEWPGANAQLIEMDQVGIYANNV